MYLQIKNLPFFDMIRKKCRKSANGISVNYRQRGLQGMLFLRMHYPSGFTGKNADKFIYKKELSCLTKNSLRLQGIHGRDLISYFR